jgi:hypothetical protein
MSGSLYQLANVAFEALHAGLDYPTEFLCDPSKGPLSFCGRS